MIMKIFYLLYKMKEVIESHEELWFSWYLEALKKAGYIRNYTHQVKSIILNKEMEITYIKPMKRVPDKVLKKTIIPIKVYTPDFKVEWSKEKFGGSILSKWFHPNTYRDKLISIIEVKGNWDQNNMTRLFKQNQAIVWDKHGVFVQLLKLPDLFKYTFTPDRYLLTNKTMKPRIIKFKTKKLDEFLLEDPSGSPKIS